MLEAPQNQSTLQVNSNCDLTFGDHTALKTFLEQCPNISQAIRDELMRVYYEEYLILLEEKQPSLPLLVCTLIGFTIMILFGTIGSGLVIFVILRNPAMRTRSNLFIMNLAISDLTLCLITQPFTLYRLLIGHHPWTLGQFMCKFSAMFQGTNIFVSTISITAIALDRFKVSWSEWKVYKTCNCPPV
ncbi:uncharacterized protein DEA37_0011624 [Paragonimus westermani]|uniref:G-protein coupled receptors family 1 profile domain-containing protein n=1 Tax=Paragonimus westermani TaxID=34504 RepID=A0A5J4NQ82_9TREM|nr:uncharacterized protein DEA37_0011624 [Paragonimus westermani]